NEDARKTLEATDAGAARLGDYLYRMDGLPVYRNTEVTYLPLGDDMLHALVWELENAKSFIFMEYFSIEEGFFWGNILEILVRKAKEGVEVRVLCDGTSELTTLSPSYARKLRARGIKCRMFNPVTPFLSTYYNYRDHRKITVIDGCTAFNGGINLCDEYINKKKRFGHWKDTAVMLKGEAARSFTLMFQRMWWLEGRKTEMDSDMQKYLNCPISPVESDGFVIPYGDSPLDGEMVGERVYMDILNRATRYVKIMTPYLILDHEMENALKYAAERGVEVTLMLPGIPDKKAPYILAKTHYKTLLASGVRIFEYSPGFLHAKVFVADDREAVVGTINLDYRSFYHHFECATYMNGASCISDIVYDYDETLGKCREVTKETVKKQKFSGRLAGALLKAIAPLM
ncbi:MAG: cardiolipin synthase, partial [Clostridia bacterium]|nr:cardiolipin synthase [Clostridia bacterium]